MDLDYNVSSGPFLSFEIEIGDGPGPELDNNYSRSHLSEREANEKFLEAMLLIGDLQDRSPLLTLKTLSKTWSMNLL